MLSIKKIKSVASAESLKSYVISRVGGSVLLEGGRAIGLELQFHDAEIVSATDFEKYHDFRGGVGADSSPCREWLLGRILAFLEQENLPLVLIEDSIADPRDAVFSQGPIAPMWYHQHGIIWPIHKGVANIESCKEALAWGVGGPEAIFFCSPVELGDLTEFPRKFAIPDSLVEQFKASLKYFITDVFDSEGYAVIPIA
jgi:hypothetical protein